MVKKISILLVAGILSLTLLTLALPANAAAPIGVVFSEVKLGGAIAGQPTEFVELYNNSDQVINFSAGDWWLEYAKPATTVDDCTNTSWSSGSSPSNVRVTRVTGTISARGFVIIEISMNDNAGGALRLQHSGVIDDLVGWGTTSSLAPCSRGLMASIPPSGKSIQRKFDSNNFPHHSDNNSADYDAPAIPTPGTRNIETLPEPEPIPPCLGVSISEILPNPAGDDSGKEYVELLNDTSSPVNLTGCSIRVGTSSVALSGSMDPGYKVFYGLTLPNASGGEVWLERGTGSVSVVYPGDLKDDEAYGLLSGAWQAGLKPTPGEANALPVEITEGGEPVEDMPEPCPPGKYRNPETNRCRNVEAESSLTPCDPGQTRNPETNRCRSVGSSTSSLAPCGVGETRNPETNRCRKPATTGSSLNPCQSGYERNPETNRCRKVAGAKTTNPIASPAKAGSRPVSYLALAGVGGLGALYGAYEYRNSIRNFFVKRLGS